jgi:hypothetical protein
MGGETWSNGFNHEAARFEDLAIGMRFKSPEKVLAREDIKRFAAEVDTQLSSR